MLITHDNSLVEGGRRVIFSFNAYAWVKLVYCLRVLLEYFAVASGDTGKHDGPVVRGEQVSEQWWSKNRTHTLLSKTTYTKKHNQATMQLRPM